MPIDQINLQRLRSDAESAAGQLKSGVSDAVSGARSIGANNPFNNPYFTSLLAGRLDAGGSVRGSGNYSSSLGGVAHGLLDQIRTGASRSAEEAKRLFGN